MFRFFLNLINMKNILILSLICFSFVFSQVVIHDFGDKKIYDFDFFYEQPKNQWLEMDSIKKQESFDAFMKKEFVLYESEALGLDVSPEVFIRLEERKNQLLINHYYEREVALPLVESFYLDFLK